MEPWFSPNIILGEVGGGGDRCLWPLKGVTLASRGGYVSLFHPIVPLCTMACENICTHTGSPPSTPQCFACFHHPPSTSIHLVPVSPSLPPHVLTSHAWFGTQGFPAGDLHHSWDLPLSNNYGGHWLREMELVTGVNTLITSDYKRTIKPFITTTIPRLRMLCSSNVFPDRFSEVNVVFILMTSQTSIMPSGPSPQLTSARNVRTLFSVNILTGMM